jgi:hypothetical protein
VSDGWRISFVRSGTIDGRSDDVSMEVGMPWDAATDGSPLWAVAPWVNAADGTGVERHSGASGAAGDVGKRNSLSVSTSTESRRA